MRLPEESSLGVVEPEPSRVLERVDTCIYPWTTLAVDERGGVRLCCYARNPTGSLGEGGVAGVWNGAMAQQQRWFMRRGLIHPVCQGASCVYVQTTLQLGEPAGLRERVEAHLDQADYLERYPDVKAAVMRGEFKDAKAHYSTYGRAEGRLALFHLEQVEAWMEDKEPLRQKSALAENPAEEDEAWVERFDEEAYLRWNPEAERLVESGSLSCGLEHFFMAGGLESGRPFQLKEESTDPAWVARPETKALRAFSTGETKLGSQPFYLVLSPTTRCNLRCLMCPHGLGEVWSPCDAPLELLEALAPMMPGLRRVELVGTGEPLLAPLFQRLLQTWPFPSTCHVRTNTNGQLMDAGNRARLLGSGLRELSISLDASRGETYAQLRGGDFSRLVEQVRLLVQEKRASSGKGPRLWLNMVVMRHNVGQCREFIQLARRLGVEGVEFSLLAPFGDRPEWVASRRGFVFRYQEQVLRTFVDEARVQLGEALVEGRTEGLRVRARLYSEERRVLGLHDGLC